MWRVRSTHFNAPPLFCKFTDGSRRVVLKARQKAAEKPSVTTSQAANSSASLDSSIVASVHLVPMAHAATKVFFDATIAFIASEAKAAGISDPHACPPELRGAVKVLMEGLATTDEDRQTEQSEWKYISDQVLAARKGDAKADRFLYNFTHKVETNTLFLPETQREIAAGYEIPFPLPGNLLLQDAYFRPLASARFGPLLASGDICLADYRPDQQRELMEDGDKLRMERERHCAGEIRRLAHSGCRSIIVPWGHFHAPMIMARLFSADTETAAYPGSDIVFDISDADAEPIPYGWTDDMMSQVYAVS